MSKKKFDLCVIGAGPGGYVAAIRAAQLGASVAVIEKGDLGGTCLNIGCIPTKTLIAGAELFHKAGNAEEFGVKISGKITADWKTMQSRKSSVIEKLRNGIAALLKAAGVTVIAGTASFKDRKTLVVSTGKGNKTDTIQAGSIIIATGSAPLMPGFIPRSKRILTSTELLEIKKIPKSLLVLGGGVIGCEFACLFNELGTEVTVVEMLPSILPTQEKEVSRTLTQYMKKSGINILTGTPMESINASANAVSGKVGDKRVSAEFMLVSIGRQPVSDGLCLENAGVKTDDKGWIPVDSRLKTNVPGIYAIGDITGTVWQLAHWASAAGICAAENSCGKTPHFNDINTPGCIFTVPEVASVGLTTEQCKEKGIEIQSGKFPFAALGKAMAINETDGFCKIITDSETDQILGVHIIGPHATDLISEAVPAMNLEITAAELGKAIHPHPTLGEVMMEAAHAVHGESIHVAVRRRSR